MVNQEDLEDQSYKADMVGDIIEPHQQGFSFYQSEIYINGLHGSRPSLTTNPKLWEESAKQVMTPEAFAYAKGGAGSGDTMRKNVDAFQRWSIIPRMVRANVNRSLRVKVFDEIWSAPIAVAPIGVCKTFHL